MNLCPVNSLYSQCSVEQLVAHETVNNRDSRNSRQIVDGATNNRNILGEQTSRKKKLWENVLLTQLVYVYYFLVYKMEENINFLYPSCDNNILMKLSIADQIVQLQVLV